MDMWKSMSSPGGIPPLDEENDWPLEAAYGKELCILADCVGDLVRRGVAPEDILKWYTYALYLRFVEEQSQKIGEIDDADIEEPPEPLPESCEEALSGFMQQLRSMMEVDIALGRISKCILKVAQALADPAATKSQIRNIPIMFK